MTTIAIIAFVVLIVSIIFSYIDEHEDWTILWGVPMIGSALVLLGLVIAAFIYNVQETNDRKEELKKTYSNFVFIEIDFDQVTYYNKETKQTCIAKVNEINNKYVLDKDKTFCKDDR